MDRTQNSSSKTLLSHELFVCSTTFSGQSRDSLICRDTDRYPRDQHEECPCNTHQEQLVDYWSDCILSEEVQVNNVFMGSVLIRKPEGIVMYRGRNKEVRKSVINL